MKQVLMAALIGAGVISFSANASSSDEIENYQLWSSTAGIDVIRVIPSGTPITNAENCEDPDSYMVKSTLSEAAIGRIYSTLLAAKMGDKKVKLFLSSCENKRPAIESVVLL